MWVANYGNPSSNSIGTSVTELTASSSYATIQPFTVGSYPFAIAIDGANNVWVANQGGGTAGPTNTESNVMELSSAGTPMQTIVAGANPYGIAIDASGNVWVANKGTGTTSATGGNISKLANYGAAAVVVPLLNQPK